MRTRMTLLLGAAIIAVCSGTAVAERGTAEYLTDVSYRIWPVRQGWGYTGVDTAWVSWGAKPVPIRIGGKEYRKGLGTLTTGDILVELDGEYDTFEAEIGVQQPETGSVVFEVLLDGKKVFDSGVVKPEEPPKLIGVPVGGARAMRLLVNSPSPTHSYVYISANWANARLIRTAGATPSPAGMKVNIAPFARVVTSDPQRLDGAKSSRLEEFRAEDVSLETDLTPEADGAYTVPAAKEGLASIGLNWMSRRRIRELALQFTDAAEMPSPGQVDLQCWARNGRWAAGATGPASSRTGERADSRKARKGCLGPCAS